MNNSECYYLNTWPFGLDPRVKAHIVNKNNSLKAKVLRIEIKDIRLPRHRSIPILIKGQRGKNLRALALFNNRKWFLTMELES